MTRPTLTDIESGQESWDADVTDNFDKVTKAPFPIYYALDFTTLTNQFPPGQYDACFALTWDETPGNAPTLYVSNGNSWAPPAAALPTGVLSTESLLCIEDQKSSGTDGGTSAVATWNLRDLNSLIVNNIPGASLSSNQITLPLGTYWVDFDAPARSGANSLAHQTRLRNISDSTDAAIGTSEATEGLNQDTAVTRSQGTGFFSIGTSKTFELQHYTSVAVNTVGLGVAVSSGAVEIYSRIKIWKVG